MMNAECGMRNKEEGKMGRKCRKAGQGFDSGLTGRL